MEIILESLMVAERGEFLAKIRVIRVTAIVPDIATDKGKNLSSAFLATATATFTHRFWPFCATRRRNATDWPEFFIQKGLRRNRP